MSIDRAGRIAATNRFHRADLVAAQPVPVAVEAPPPDARAVEFVRFCYQRRRVSWPELYDEMCLVAARGTFRGMTYEDLAELGVTFTLAGLPPLIQLTNAVVAVERARSRPLVAAGPGLPSHPHAHLTSVTG